MSRWMIPCAAGMRAHEGCASVNTLEGRLARDTCLGLSVVRGCRTVQVAEATEEFHGQSTKLSVVQRPPSRTAPLEQLTTTGILLDDPHLRLPALRTRRPPVSVKSAHNVRVVEPFHEARLCLQVSVAHRAPGLHLFHCHRLPAAPTHGQMNRGKRARRKLLLYFVACLKRLKRVWLVPLPPAIGIGL